MSLISYEDSHPFDKLGPGLGLPVNEAQFGNAGLAHPLSGSHLSQIHCQSMTQLLRCYVVLLIVVLLISPALGGAQTPPQKPQPTQSFMAPPQTTQAEQQNFPPLLLQQLSAIKAAALNDDYAYRQVAHLTENIGPRPSGSPHARAAAEYVAAEFRKLGLEVRLQSVTVPHWVRR